MNAHRQRGSCMTISSQETPLLDCTWIPAMAWIHGIALGMLPSCRLRTFARMRSERLMFLLHCSANAKPTLAGMFVLQMSLFCFSSNIYKDQIVMQTPEREVHCWFKTHVFMPVSHMVAVNRYVSEPCIYGVHAFSALVVFSVCTLWMYLDPR